uniref:Cytoplasmic dynein 2 heavy chain 1 n=1 Tax=Globodera pallida TaxID=36090 RepID=A0A183BTS1_GLOPA
MSRRENATGGAGGGPDQRKAYLLKVASHILSLNLTEERLPNATALNAFCDSEAPLLVISRRDQAMSMLATRNQPLALDDYKQKVSVLSMHENAGQTLLGTLKQVFSRFLAEDQLGRADGNASQLASLVSELEGTLQNNFGEDGTEDSAGGVQSVRSEIELWRKRAQKATEPAQSYSEALEPLADKLATLEGDGPLDELYEVCEAAEESAEGLWNVLDDPYPQRRMRQLIICIAASLQRAISHRVASNILPSALFRSSETLRLALNLATHWCDLVELLTGRSWAQNALHQWEGEPIGLEIFQRFRKRVEEAHSLATLGEQIVQLSDRRGDSQVRERIFCSIEGAMRDSTPFGAAGEQWTERLEAAGRALDAFIEQIVPMLRAQLQFQPSVGWELILDELHRYRHFLARKQVKAKLQTEREVLITQLSEQLRSRRREIERIASAAIPTGKFLTEIAAKIAWIRNNSVQVDKLRKASSKFFNDLPIYASFEQSLLSLAEELKTAEQEQFDAWCRDMLAHVDDPGGDSISLQTTGRLMVLERDRGVLNVSYSDRLARLLREVAQLQAMGLKVPAKIIQCVKQGEKFYQYGVAHFYNTIEQQMLPCQQAMLLDEALAFERLVLPSPGGKQRDERGAAAVNITWENPEKLKQYINKLREAAFNLTNHNRRLRKAHAEITQIVAELGHVDLLREEAKWSAKLIEIRQKFVDEERFVAVKSNMQPWANHWNRQLYKVLQLQFRWAMEDVDSQIPTLNAQLVFRDHRLQFRPPLEELRQQYYKGLRKLLSTPQRLRGVQNNTREMELFGRIVARNASRFHQLYLRSEEMFERLRTIDRNFDEWVALAQVNLEDLLEQNLHNASDWEHQLNLLKQKQRSAERIPNEIRVDCVRVSTAGVRTFALDLLKRFHDALSWTLRHSIRTELQSVEQTLNQGVDKLSKLPESLEEVAEANYTQSTLSKSSKVIRTKIYTIEEKDQLLRSLFGSDQGVDSVPSTKDQFTHFLSLLEGHELVMRDQVNVMKEKVRESLQKLGDDLEKLHSLWNQFKPRSEIFTSQDDRMALVKAVEFIRGKRQEFDAIVKRMHKVRMECEQFELEQSEWPLFVELNEDLEQYESNYLLYEDFSNELQPLAEQEWVLFRSKTYLFDEFLQKWLEKLKETSGSNVAVRLRKDIEQMREFSNSLKFCRGEVFSADHWLEMFRLLKLPRGTSLERLTFGELLNCQQAVLNNELNARAHGEVSIREAIQELEMWAAQAEFALADYRHSDGTALKVVKEWKTVLNQVRDNHALLQSLRSSPYYVQFREQVHLWERRVTDLDLQLHSLNDIQRRWVYLEPIFSRGALPSETARFNRIDAEFRAILNDIAADNRIMALNAKNASLGRTLEQLVDQLGRCQRALSSFLEEKRTAFPRFYFLGDDDLLEIVGQSTNPAVIQSHLKKLFQGINRVVFDAEQQSIRAIVSAEGEIVQMLKPIQIVPRVEQWLSALSEEMRNTLKRLVVDCLQEKSLDPVRFPSQVLCLTEQIRFCSDVEKCMASIAGTPGDQLAAYRRQLIGQLEQLNSANAEEAIVRLKLKSLVLDVTHHVGVVDQLLRTDNNGYIGCWAWQRQLRFYLVSGLVVVRQAEYEFAYTYEYQVPVDIMPKNMLSFTQGNGAKLVHTPLTDKCYLTLTQALGMGLGGNPYGPAGTGKTESVKSLAGLLGRQVDGQLNEQLENVALKVLVFNCDEGIDVQAIVRIFVGLIQCGAWGCFDEFNRLGRGVLSAVSSQVQLIQEAVRTKTSHCQIADVSVPVDFNSAIFVTLNPAGKGYGGRQRLPDNLKQLFRPVAMSVPDNQQISETLLFAEGFGQAKLLAKKLVTAFGLAKEMLSAQQHYDWGLRALKTVLKGCADAIGKQRQKTRQRLGEQEEMELVVQNLQLNTLSKLTFADSRRFRVLLDGIFPGTKRETAQFDELLEHIQKASEHLQLRTTDVQLQKLSELYEQLRQRIGVIIVGPPGSGKSTLWRLLQKTLSLSGAQTVDVYSMDPKAMPRGRLLGHLDLDTREWTDGTLTQAARLATKDPNKPAWIVCDGDVDPEWIESLNSVLDDNKLLTLPSGERIQFGPNVNFLFECVDLTYASPATISRMGMILMSREDLEVQTLIDRFIYRNEKELPAQFGNWLDKNLVPALNWTIMHQTREFSCSQIGILKNALSLVQNAKSKNQFLVGLLRAFAPFVEPDARRELCQGVIFQGATVPDPKIPLNVYCDARTDTLLSYSDDIGLPIQLDEFRRRAPVVLSVRMQIVRDILMEWLRPKGRERPPANAVHLEPILLLGPEGCGKQSLLRECFEGAGMQAQKLLLNMHCSANTTAHHLEQLLYEHCVQVSGPSGRCLKPRENEQLVLHLKGPNLARPDQYGTSQLIAFLEQMVEYRGFYDRSLEWIGLDNVQLVISISSTFSAERFALPERFTSKLRVLSMDGPSETELKTIYAAYLAPILGKQQMNSQSKTADSLAGSLTNVFVELTKVFTPSEQFHYVFTPSDMTNWTNGLLRYGVGADSAALNSFINFECQRIFGDRLVSAEHRQHFQNILQEHFPVRSASSNFAPLPGPILANELDGRPMLPISREDYIGQLEKVINRLRHEQHCPTQQLSNAFVDMCLSVDRASMDPKAMPRGRLLGHLDLDTREWTDGTLTQAARLATKTEQAGVDCLRRGCGPEWIESLNSVLDDNKLLTLPSGERIQFGPNVNFLFECVDLTYASPATISRMGMILMSREDLEVQTLIDRFIYRNEKELPAQFGNWLDKNLVPALNWTIMHQTRDFACSQIGILKNALSLVQNAKSKNQFLVGLLRAFAPFVEPDARRELCQGVIFQGATVPDPKIPLNVYCDARTDNLLSYSDDIGLPIQLDEFRRRAPVVLSVRMQIVRDILMEWLRPKGRERPPANAQSLLRECFEGAGMQAQKLLLNMHCSANTTAHHLEQLLYEHCVQVSGPSGRCLKPRENEQLVLHLKGPNLARPDQYGTSQLIAFLEQMVEYRGFYDRSLEWIGLDNVQLVISISSAFSAERFALPERFTSKLRVLSMDGPSETELKTIYAAYLAPILGKQQMNSQGKTADSLAGSLTNVFVELTKVFTPSEQFHYVFTPSDMTNWTNGLLRYGVGADSAALHSFINFECQRIFGDRLVSAEHRQHFQNILQEHFPVRSASSNFAPLPGSILANELDGRPMLPISREDYIGQLEKVINRLKHEQHCPTQQLSNAFVDMCLSVDRAITCPGGAVLLAGRAGMGRRAAVTFVAQMHQMRLHTLRVSSSYTSRNFAQDLKEAIYSACVDAEQVVLLVEDYQLLEESFLQLINALLSDGYVPGLYGTQQELDQILGRLRESSMDDGFSGAGSLHAYFAHRVRSNLHLALLMDVAHPKFVPRILSNPALYKRCIMIWHESWSPETLSQIASLSLKQNGVEQPPNSLLSAFVQLFVRAPAECRSPAKFSGFVDTFHALLNSKRAAVEKRLARLRAGVDKLTETRNAVAKLQKKAAKKSKLLAEKQAEANSALGQITQSMSGATEQKEDMEKLKSATEAENVKIEEQKKLIEQQLADVEPLLNEARKAVGSLKSEHLSEVRSLRSPATSIRDILEAVLLFMGILDTSWESMRRFLAKSGVKEEVINFDVRRITPSTAKKVGTLVKSKAASFDPINAKNASAAIAPLAAWVTANLQYALILEKIAPLEQKKESLVKNLDAAEHQMERLSKGLKSLDKKVTGLKTNFESCMKEATEIKIELDREQATIVVAGKLVERLGGEYSRWQQQQKVLEDELKTVENCCLIGAAFITFLGGASEEMRAQTMGHWRGVCQLPAEFDLLNFLASETDQLRWKLEGLLTNNLALENGAILFGAKNSPFIVDPSGTVCTFLANHFKGSSTEVLRANQSDLMTQVELGVRFGKTLIIDEMDELVEPALVPLLRRDFHTIGARLAVQLGEKQATKHSLTIIYLLISSVVAEINFSITRSGLASQLLSLAIELEKPELEQSSAQLSSQMEGLKLEMDSLEQVLLEQLAVSGGSLLDNTSLLESLNESKEKADKVAHGLSDLQRLRALTDSQRDTFLPFAQRCAQLYFAVRPFHTVKHCYQFSVNDSVALFRKCFVESNERQNASEGHERLDRVFRRLRLRLFEFVSRSLFKEDRLTFGMQFVHATASNAAGSGTLFGRNEWELFTRVLPPPGESTSSANIGWLDRERRAAIERVQLHLPALFQSLQIGDQPTWATFMKSVECENAFPASVNAKLSDFQRLIVLQALRPDRLHVGMLRFTSKLLGVDSLRGASLDFASIHQRESVPQQPILLLIAPGSSADLSAELADYAHGEFAKASSGQKLHQLAMGEGQAESTAMELLRNCALGGDWLCLYNVHLNPPVVGRLMTELGSLSGKLHANFRLWLTAEPDDQLPVVFLQACLKATYETPPGLKKNLERNFVEVPDERAATRRGPGEASKAKSVFVLHWLHAVMQERRNFIPQAWLKAYEFSEADLRTAKMALQSLFGIVERNNLKGVDWEMFRGLMLNAIYGGRIEVELDNRVLLAFLLELFNFNMIDGAGGELAPGLKMPLFGEQKGFVDWISSTLPETDRPELMFLPRNIMLSWDLVQSDAAVAKLRRLFTAVALSQQIAPAVDAPQSPELSDTKIFSKRLWNDSLGPILSLWKKLNQQNPQLLQSAQEEQKQRPISASRPEKAHPTASGHEEDPLVEMLQLEFVYSLKMLHCIHSSLSAISRAIKGINLPEKCTIELAQSLINFQIPMSWDALWSGGPSVPAQYLEELIYKVRSTQTLLSQAKSQQLLSVPVSLGQLFRPATLLNAFRQYSARKLGASLDELELCTHWHGAVQQMADNAAAPKMTLSLLCIQGALFDGVELRPVTPSAAPFSPVPQLHILWAKINSNAPAEAENQLRLPLFADAERREAPVIEVKVPCSPASKNLWTLAGVALFLSGQPE